MPVDTIVVILNFTAIVPYNDMADQRPRSKDIMLSASWVVSSIASLMSFASDTTWAWKAATEQGWTRTTPALDKVLQSKADVVAMSFLGKLLCHATRCRDYHFPLELHEIQIQQCPCCSKQSKSDNDDNDSDILFNPTWTLKMINSRIQKCHAASRCVPARALQLYRQGCPSVPNYIQLSKGHQGRTITTAIPPAWSIFNKGF